MLNSLSSAVSVSARRLYSTEPLPTPGSNATVDPKIATIVDQIEGLTLLQTSELVSQLKVHIITRDLGCLLTCIE
jgi:large subunit ribosomal protein L7/L12